MSCNSTVCVATHRQPTLHLLQAAVDPAGLLCFDLNTQEEEHVCEHARSTASMPDGRMCKQQQHTHTP